MTKKKWPLWWTIVLVGIVVGSIFLLFPSKHISANQQKITNSSEEKEDEDVGKHILFLLVIGVAGCIVFRVIGDGFEANTQLDYDMRSVTSAKKRAEIQKEYWRHMNPKVIRAVVATVITIALGYFLYVHGSGVPPIDTAEFELVILTLGRKIFLGVLLGGSVIGLLIILLNLLLPWKELFQYLNKRIRSLLRP